MNTLYGFNIVVNPLCQGEPRMVLRPDICTAEFTAEYNEWLLNFFGRKPDKVYTMGNSMFMTQESLAKIKHLTMQI